MSPMIAGCWWYVVLVLQLELPALSPEQHDGTMASPVTTCHRTRNNGRALDALKEMWDKGHEKAMGNAGRITNARMWMHCTLRGLPEGCCSH
ncbi:GD15863 [Drosophila simulans]|uniref:GD15863 n=1 Tax=Drosophila simulans TaxID=7240 RepID=B4R4L8_DROSI|nr:GD15863 [Drosophila simulans]